MILVSRRSKIIVRREEKLVYRSNNSYRNVEMIGDIVSQVDLSEEKNYDALMISISLDIEINLKIPESSCFVKNYNPIIPNVDIQPLFIYNSLYIYICNHSFICVLFFLAL